MLVQTMALVYFAVFQDPPQSPPLSSSTADEESDGECVEVSVQLSVKSALASAESKEWQVAIDKEHAALVGKKVWGDPLTAAEVRELRARGVDVVPVAILLHRKRDMSFKCRAVALGDRIPEENSPETYAPVASLPSQRFLLVEMASEGDHLYFYDLITAFLNAPLFEEVVIKLPPEFCPPGSGPYRKLIRALYGLRQAPRRWWETFTNFLKSRGWVPCEYTEGLFKKPSAKVPGKFLKQSVYVDDVVLGGPDASECLQELEEILARFPGKRIHGVEKVLSTGTFEYFDLTGVDCYYSRSRRELLLNMTNYIEKLVTKFEVSGKDVMSPSFDENNFTKGKVVKDFPWRSLIGGLNWVVSAARPDIAVAVSILARYNNAETTTTMIRAAKRVLRYLRTTKHVGVWYSPESQSTFEQIYSSLLPEDRPLPSKVLFGDCSFASVLYTFRSVSGCAIFYMLFQDSKVVGRIWL